MSDIQKKNKYRLMQEKGFTPTDMRKFKKDLKKKLGKYAFAVDF